MPSSVEHLVKSARECKGREFTELLEDSIDILSEERAAGRVAGHSMKGGLVCIGGDDDDMPERLVVVGDIHGDLEALQRILNMVRFFDEDSTLVFLGDYGDRGLESVEVYHALLSLKHERPDRIVMLRGNHEGPMDLPFYPHDLPVMLQDRFGADSTHIYLRLRRLFDLMCTGVLVEGLVLMLHGGVPVKMGSIDDIAYAEKMHPKSSNLLEILWNDPKEINGYRPSARGYGYYFGKDVTEHALSTVGARLLVRAHEPCNDGYRLNHDGLVLTLFSCKEPYGNERGAFMHMRRDVYREMRGAYSVDRLLSSLHVF